MWLFCHLSRNFKYPGKCNCPFGRRNSESKKQVTDAWHKDGYRNAIWVLLDYGDIMVHVFQKDAREFYNLEGLWADAKIKQLEDEN